MITDRSQTTIKEKIGFLLIFCYAFISGIITLLLINYLGLVEYFESINFKLKINDQSIRSLLKTIIVVSSFFTPIVWIIVFSCFLLFFTRIIIRNKEKYLSFYDSLSITVASYSIIMVDQIIKFGISINNKKLVLISIGSPSFWFKRVPQVLSSFNLLFILFLIVVAVFLKKYSIKAKRSILSLTIIYLLITFGMGMVS